MRPRPVLQPRREQDPRLRPADRLRSAPQPALLRPVQRSPRPVGLTRSRLVRPLLDDSRALVALVAPAGYGKSTLLSQWRARDPRPFAWGALAAGDDDPARLVETIAAALCATHPPIAAEATVAVTVDDLARALASLPPTVVVLDDLHHVRSMAALAIVERLAAHLPAGSTLAVSSRLEPALPLSRLRAQDELVELRADALRMTRIEGAVILHRARLRLAEKQSERLLERTAGWPAALHLAVRAIKAGAEPEAFDGDDAFVVEYVRDEILAGLEPGDCRFLARASVLETLSGPACDALLERRDSAQRLRRLSRENVPLAALDRTELNFRLHPLVAQALCHDLGCREPALADELHGRASAWYERSGDLERAVEHALVARDTARVAGMLADRAPGLVADGRIATLDAWLERLGAAATAELPALALAAAARDLARGDRDAAEFWAVHAKRRGASEPALAVVRAAVARDGIAAQVTDAARAWAIAPPDAPWRAYAALLEGAGHCVAGRTSDATERLTEGARVAALDAPLVRSLCLAQLAFLALEGGDGVDAAALAASARSAIASGPAAAYPLGALTFAVSALVLASCGSHDPARQDADEAQARLAGLPDPPPWYGALVRLALARTLLRLSDAFEARRLLTDASRSLRQAPGATALQAWINDAWARADNFAAGPVGCPTVLTRAELRVLRLLPSHLTFGEIAARLHVSPNTVKTQAHAVYRKLEARSRSQAVAHATAIGLLG